MTFTHASIPDLTGKVAVVTGANGGLGLETARALSGRGAHVVMAARNHAKATTARDNIQTEHPAASTEIVQLDLASLESVRDASTQILTQHERIDLLINNAGLMAMPERATVDGFEMQLGVNHLGHWALTAHLMPALLRASAARIVSVTSTAHHFGRRLDPDNPNLQGSYGPWRAYGQSKLANYHFAIGLQQRFETAGVDAVSMLAHPGLTNSDLQSHAVDEGGAGILGPFFDFLSTHTGMTTEQGARPQLRAATDPEARGGSLYAPRYGNNGPAVRRPLLRPGRNAAIDILWKVSLRETGLAIDVTP
jgi:NAD(P)-dependent dehydrogenase (short-subunit alcohol dehydrogenase family)